MPLGTEFIITPSLCDFPENSSKKSSATFFYSLQVSMKVSHAVVTSPLFLQLNPPKLPCRQHLVFCPVKENAFQLHLV